MTPNAKSIRVWGLVPAAGMSRRMGTSKQTLTFGGTTIVAAVVRTMLSARADGVVVVTRSGLKDALMLPDDLRVTAAFNDDANSQMIDSVRLGLTQIVESSDFAAGPRDGVLIIPGDMPTISAEACRLCMDAYKRLPGRIVIAAYRSRRGHPIVLPIAFRRRVEELEGGLNELSRGYRDCVEEVDVADPGILRDIDTREDYAKLSS